MMRHSRRDCVLTGYDAFPGERLSSILGEIPHLNTGMHCGKTGKRLGVSVWSGESAAQTLSLRVHMLMPKQVSILDDNADNRELLFFALMMRDYDIHQAGLSRDAQRLLEKTPIDLALLDVELPDGDGLDLAEKVRGHNPDAVLVMLSANDSIELLEHARTLGANAYVVKPFNLPKLLGFIQNVEDEVVTSATEMQML